MSEIKCKACGETIEYKEGEASAVCPKCGATQELPALDEAEILRRDKIYSGAEANIRTTVDKKLAYTLAIKKFKSIPGWKDADERVIECEKAIKELEAKEEADRLERERKTEERRIAKEKAAKKRKKIFMIATPIVCVIIAFIIVLTTVIVPKIEYAKMKDYTSAKVGDHIYFGEYEQDNDTTNGKEEIEWIVLAKEDNKILVISDKALDFQQYDISHNHVTWETCTLRTWLNSTFLNEAFTAEEQSQILNTTVSADKNPDFSTNPGNSTTDKIFLLSVTEAEKYFSDEDKNCIPTAYARARGAYTSGSFTKGGVNPCRWWLRSPGDNEYCAAYVYYGVWGDYYGYDYCTNNGCVRPALWINLES